MKSRPILPFRNGHITTILGNNGPRKWLVARRADALNRTSREVILACRDDVRLHGIYTPAKEQRRLVILLHGWEGCSTSTYLQSMALRLYKEGCSIFRLHMRDHGPSHHLNEAPFLAIRLDEVLDAIEQICALYPHEDVSLAGFSLGANFAVRVAANMGERAITLDRVVAFCPPIDPEAAAYAIQSYPIYNRYFIGKWQKSFAKKVALFDSYGAHRDLLVHTDLVAMHEDFVPRFSEHPNASSYFRAYALTGHNIRQMHAPCHVIMVGDDPIIPVATLDQLADLDGLTSEVADFGGHCGFVSDLTLDSWADEKMMALLDLSR